MEGGWLASPKREEDRWRERERFEGHMMRMTASAGREDEEIRKEE